MAARLRGVADMNTRSSIRIARTAITGAENRARVDSYVSANDMGIECEKQWMAALDGRTRDSHRKLDGTRMSKLMRSLTMAVGFLVTLMRLLARRITATAHSLPIFPGITLWLDVRSSA